MASPFSMRISKDDSLNTFYIYEADRVIRVWIPGPDNCIHSWSLLRGVLTQSQAGSNQLVLLSSATKSYIGLAQVSLYPTFLEIHSSDTNTSIHKVILKNKSIRILAYCGKDSFLIWFITVSLASSMCMPHGRCLINIYFMNY